VERKGHRKKDGDFPVAAYTPKRAAASRPAKKNEETAEVGHLTKPFYYHYPLLTIHKSILLVTSALNSLRGAVGSLSIFSDVYSTALPAHTTIQNWIVQYGIFELLRPLPRRDDWVYILDHTIEFSTQKCLLILGITLEQFRKNNCIIRHEDVRVLHISLSKQPDGEEIFKKLTLVVQATGIPRQIISDAGSDIKKGIEMLCEHYTGIIYTYDITHKCAVLLKHALEHDIRWNQFVRECQMTKRNTLHTDLAFLTPPKPREKSRWMNLDLFVTWAENINTYRDTIHAKVRLSAKDKKVFIDKFNHNFSWIKTYESRLQEWRQILNVLTLAKHEVKHKGLHKKTENEFKRHITPLHLSYPRIELLVAELTRFFRLQTSFIPEGECMIGSSDIIESIFGKYKNFSARTAMQGIGKIILTIPVFTSKITLEKIKKALETVSIKSMHQWIDQNIGQSLFAKRKQAFCSN
jgi:hypothetical protein